MAYNRYRQKARIKHQIIFTRTKAIVGFIVSCLISVLLSAYLEKYGWIVLEQSGQALSAISEDTDIHTGTHSTLTQSTISTLPKIPKHPRDQLNQLRESNAVKEMP